MQLATFKVNGSPFSPFFNTKPCRNFLRYNRLDSAKKSIRRQQRRQLKLVATHSK